MIMKKEYSFEELLHKVASYCSISEHCISEVDEKLQKWEVSFADREKIINRMVSEDFINEERYAKAFVKDKFRFNKWGKIKISLALKAKRVDDVVISEALSIIDEGEYEEMLSAILKTKLSSLKYNFEYEKQGKLYRFAQSRGFENNVIECVLRNM
ncbi:RecX family transcriptional regulator [Paludibacter sp. 221]|nr:RecX family transcriptional regulator [Paludibacter sp. 221]